MTKITINGREVDADPAQPLIRACHDHGADVPMYCYHPGLSPVGSCRICQVEVQQGDMPPRVVVACRTPVVEGMVVDTEAERAHETRRECLEFLLKNHPLDCPICDKAGECDLQDYAFAEGQGKGRSAEPRRKLEKRKSLGDVIVLDQERCILCSRCTRFMEEVPRTPQLTVSDLGSRSVIETFMDRPLTGNYQGNLADICPVGALTLKEFRFQARVWNLRKTPSTCAECSRGCAITVETLRGGEVKRFRPRPDLEVNQYWMCDTGRFALDRANLPARLPAATLRGQSGLEEADVEDAVDVLADMVGAHRASAVVLVSPFATQEEAAAVQRLAAELGAAPAFVSPPPNDLKDDVLHTGDPCPNRRGLTGLGFEALTAEDALARLADAELAVLAGERVVELVGAEGLAAVRASLRLVVLDAVPVDVPALDVALGVPTHVEKSGTWVNVDGVRRRLSLAVPPPVGVAPLEQTVERMLARLQAAEVRG